MKKKDYILVTGILAVHLLLLIVLKFTAWPEMSLWPYLIAKGWLPYRDIAIAHTPLMLFDLGLFYKIFGTGILQLKIFTWLLILIFDGLVFFVARKLWNTKAAFIALGAFAFWNLFYDGNGLWFDLYMGLMAFYSFYFARQKKWLWTGVFWALAFVSKQTAVWFLIPILLELEQSTKYRVQNFKKLITGTLSVFVPFFLIMWAVGVLPDFWNWAVKFGIFILPKAQGQVQLPDFKNLAVATFPFLIFIPLILKSGRKNLNILVWAVAGSLGAFPRFEFFHFQSAVPFLAIATGLVFERVKKEKKLFKPLVPVYITVSIILFAGFFMRNFKEGTRFYEANVANVVTFVNYNTKPGDRIFVLNWWDNIYALTDTLPATDPWVPQLSWYMEIPGVQEKIVEDLKANPPKMIIYNSYTMSGLSSYIPQKVYNFVTENYKITQRVDNLEVLTKK